MSPENRQNFTVAQLESIFTAAEKSIDSAKTNLAIKIEEKIKTRARTLGEERFPMEPVLKDGELGEARLLILGPFRGVLNWLVYIDPQGEIRLTEAREIDMKSALDLDASIPIHDEKDYEEKDMIDLSDHATTVFRSVLRFSAE